MRPRKIKLAYKLCQTLHFYKSGRVPERVLSTGAMANSHGNRDGREGWFLREASKSVCSREIGWEGAFPTIKLETALL